MRRLSGFVVVVALAGALTAGTVAVLAPQVGAVLAANRSAQVTEIDLNPLAQRSVVLASDGSLLAVLHGGVNRKSIPLADVPQVVVDTVLAVEDADFWEHGGVNLRATSRALMTNVAAGDAVQGGSTITQQLVKNDLLSPEQDLDRKVREAVLAVRIEEQMSKEEILERYLNTVYLGSGVYGIQAAAEVYFGIDAVDLGQAESAFLAGLIRHPTGYDPFRFPEASLARRDDVVDRLVAVGQVTPARGERLKAAPIPTERRSSLPSPKDHFVDEVVQLLLADPRLGETRDERRAMVFEGGLAITTTLSPALQHAALVAVAEEMPDTGGEFTASVVSVEPSTGAVRALVGGEGFEEAQFNIATRGIGRQPGSSFKPFILATHLENGGSPRDTISGVGPCKLPNPGGEVDPYEVSNFGSSRGGVYDLRGATTRSNNCAYTRLGIIAGLDKVVEVTRSLGVTSPLSALPSMSLGTLEVRPIDMAGAYATFANGGVHNEPYFIEEVLDANGEVLLAHEPKPRRAVSADTAAVVTDLLVSNVTGGTGTRARFPDGRPAAGKTGTTQDFADAWFVGYVPQMATAVWMGSPRGNDDKMTNVGGIRVTGGSYPARIWAAAMHAGLAGTEPMAFPPMPRVKAGTVLRLPGEKPPGGTERRVRRVRSQPVEEVEVVASEPTPAPAPQPPPPTSPPPPPSPEPQPEPKPQPKPEPEPEPEPQPSDGGGGGGGDGEDPYAGEPNPQPVDEESA